MLTAMSALSERLCGHVGQLQYTPSPTNPPKQTLPHAALQVARPLPQAGTLVLSGVLALTNNSNFDLCKEITPPKREQPR